MTPTVLSQPRPGATRVTSRTGLANRRTPDLTAASGPTLSPRTPGRLTPALPTPTRGTAGRRIRISVTTIACIPSRSGPDAPTRSRATATTSMPGRAARGLAMALSRVTASADTASKARGTTRASPTLTGDMADTAIRSRPTRAGHAESYPERGSRLYAGDRGSGGCPGRLRADPLRQCSIRQCSIRQCSIRQCSIRQCPLRAVPVTGERAVTVATKVRATRDLATTAPATTALVMTGLVMTGLVMTGLVMEAPVTKAPVTPGPVTTTRAMTTPVIRSPATTA